MVAWTMESLFYETIKKKKKIHPMTYDLYNHEYTFSLFLIGYGLNLKWVRSLVSQLVGFNTDMELKYVLKMVSQVKMIFSLFQLMNLMNIIMFMFIIHI